MDIRKLIMLIAVAIAGFGVQLQAQDYYEDDIYYDASKSKKNTQVKTENNKAGKPVAEESYSYGSSSYSYGYPSSGTYSTHGVVTRDVDEYNRRGYYAITDTVVADTVANEDDFAYTRRIERFYNPSIVAGSSDTQLREYYYDSEPEVNIVVNTPGYWGGWYAPYSGWSLSWGWGTSSWYWNSWYSPYWGCYDPYWSWGGWWGPAWYPPYHHHHHGYFPGGHWKPSPVRPGRYNGPGRNGASPGRNVYRAGGHRNAGHAARPGVSSGNGERRQSGSAVRPGSRPSTTRQNSGTVGTPRRGGYENSGGYSRPSTTRSERSSFSRPSGGSSRGSFSGGSRGGGSRGGGRGGRH